MAYPRIFKSGLQDNMKPVCYPQNSEQYRYNINHNVMLVNVGYSPDLIYSGVLFW
jgi:hypothetical protein